LTEWAGDRETPWERIEVDWYGGERNVMQVFSGTGLWYTRGQDPVAIRYVLARDLEGRLSDAAYFCTDERFGPEEILKYVVQRCVEVTFEEARAHLGLETQRQWSDLAIARTTPVLLGLFSVVTLLGVQWHRSGWPGSMVGNISRRGCYSLKCLFPPCWRCWFVSTALRGGKQTWIVRLLAPSRLRHPVLRLWPTRRPPQLYRLDP
jgi:hypothetical protein